MIQLFFQIAKISAQDWEIAYRKIADITTAFPLPLLRVESYSSFEQDLNKDHSDLRLNVGELDEHISFYGDEMSFTFGNTLRFYKNWNLHIKEELRGEYIENKPITWSNKPYVDNGDIPVANGKRLDYLGYETGDALYGYAVLAIGTMLENLMPGRVFMIASEHVLESVEKVVDWLEWHFKEDFDLPI